MFEKIIKDVEDEKWRKKIKDSVSAILTLYKLKLNEIIISRTRLYPKELYVAAMEECNPEFAKELIKIKYFDTIPPPITVIQYKNKKVIFMGSNRSLVHFLKTGVIDSLIIKLPDNIKEPKIISEAKITLEELLKRG